MLPEGSGVNSVAYSGGTGLIFPDYYGLMKLSRFVIAVIIGFFAPLAAISTVQAHTDLVSTSPAADSVTEVPPAFISVTFSEPPITEGAAIVLSDVAGNEIPVGEVIFDGAKISVASPPDLPPTEYVVTWRISAEDGHVLTGEFNFTYNGDAAVSNTSPMATPLAVDSNVVEPVQDVAAESGAAIESTNIWTYVLAAVFVAAIVGTLIVAKKRN